MHACAAPVLFTLCSVASAQTGVFTPLAQECSPSLPNVFCIQKYASVIPYHFFRNISNGTSSPTFGSTSVPNDTSFALVDKAEFLVFDRDRGLEILGTNPTYDFVFKVSEAVHEAPVYVPSQNKLYLSQVYHHDQQYIANLRLTAVSWRLRQAFCPSSL